MYCLGKVADNMLACVDWARISQEIYSSSVPLFVVCQLFYDKLQVPYFPHLRANRGNERENFSFFSSKKGSVDTRLKYPMWNLIRTHAFMEKCEKLSLDRGPSL